MYLLWPQRRVIICVRCAAPYKKKADVTIKIFYPKIIHITCLAHGLHRIAELVRVHYPRVDKLVSSVNQV